MAFLDDINSAIAKSMKARDQVRLSTLRTLKSALVNKSVEKGHELDEAEAMQVVTSQIKQRHDSIEQFAKGGRQDLVDKETAEIRILETYLPPAADAEETARVIEAAIAETGASSAKDLGRVMKLVMAKLAGRGVDGKRINELVRTRLGGR